MGLAGAVQIPGAVRTVPEVVQAGEVDDARFVVHGLSPRGGRSVTMHRAGYAEDDYVGTAFSEHDLLLILRSTGLVDPDLVVDDPRWVDGEAPLRTGGVVTDRPDRAWSNVKAF